MNEPLPNLVETPPGHEEVDHAGPPVVMEEASSPRDAKTCMHDERDGHQYHPSDQAHDENEHDQHDAERGHHDERRDYHGDHQGCTQPKSRPIIALENLVRIGHSSSAPSCCCRSPNDTLIIS